MGAVSVSKKAIDFIYGGVKLGVFSFRISHLFSGQWRLEHTQPQSHTHVLYSWKISNFMNSPSEYKNEYVVIFFTN